MATKIKHKRSAVAGNVPSTVQLESGELAINTADGSVYLLRDDNTIQDITARIHKNDSEITVSDTGDSSLAEIKMRINNNDKLNLTEAGFAFKDNLEVDNAKKLTFRELDASGADGISLKAPDTLPASYNLTLPEQAGATGQLLRTDATGQLSFVDPDVFGGNVIYVSAEKGNDLNDGFSAPVKTLKKACKIASGLVYNADGTTNGKRVNIKVAVGDYTEDNPIIVPDNVVVKGDGLRGCIIRPANANLDMLRVRNACYFGEFTFRDGVDENFVPLITFDYATVFDDPTATDITDRAEYTNLPNTRPFITTSPYIQNCSILSFLGGSGAKIDGALIATPNIGTIPLEQENPVIGAIPEQGKSMVANAYTMLSFGGTGWRLMNDAYAQIVSCFQIFLLNGVYTQSGGYCSITNSATNFGLYALRSSGYSPKAFEFDRAFVTSTGIFETKQTLSIVGINRTTPIEEFVLRFREPGYKQAYDYILEAKNTIADDTVTWINQQIAGFDPTNATYEPSTGVMEITIGSHDIEIGDKVRLKPNSFTFYCATGGPSQPKTYPRAVAGDGDPDPSYNVPVTVDDKSSTTITLNVGVSQDTSQHFFVSADAGAVVKADWYNFTYNIDKCRRDTKLIVDAVAQDTFDSGNRNSRSTGLAYYSKNLADSSRSTISGQEIQTQAAILKAKSLTDTYITSLSTAVRDFVGSRFDIVANAVTDPNSIPAQSEVSSEGDITNDFKTTPGEKTFNGNTAVDAVNNVITITNHGFTNKQRIIYNANGNPKIPGLDDEQTYYVKLINGNEFSLCFDDSISFNVDILGVSSGTHKFLTGVVEYMVTEITQSHNTYQTLILESGAESQTYIPGKAITGTTGASNNSAIVYSWEPNERRLVVSIEEVAVGASTLRVQFDATSVITADHAGSPATNIGVNEAASKLGLGTATFSITATDGSSTLTNLVNLPEKQVWFHRPSIVNSSAHTWEYAGSGTDYNALPQNGGNTDERYEQFEELPGRCYSSGTNELGDFKVGNFITAFNRTGNITFKNKVKVDELDALKLSLSNVEIEEISTSVNLGDDETGGAKNERLSTQLAVRSFISNRLGGFVDKSVSTAAVPGAIVQLNTNGQLNPELIPATRQFTNTTTPGYLSKLTQIDFIPAVDLKAGDIATEEYEQVELIVTGGTITAADGATITQPGITGAIGYAKGTYASSSNILVATIGSAWDDTDDSTGDPWDVAGVNLFVDGVDSGVTVQSKGVSSAITDNFFLKSSNSSQFLILPNTGTFVFTTQTISTTERSSNISLITTAGAHNLRVGNTVEVVITSSDTSYNEKGKVLTVPTPTSFTISNTGSNTGSASATGTVRTIVTSADGNAQGAVTEIRSGVLTNVDNANITGGSGYTPTTSTKTYKDVALTGGSGSGARADITVTQGAITDVDLIRGGTGYSTGVALSVNAADVGGTGSSFSINTSAIERRIYVNILGGELFVASSSSIDFVEDNAAIDSKKQINLDDTLSQNFLAGTTVGGGAVDYTDFRITINNHGFTNGDPVTYDTLGNVAIGNLINGTVYYVKRIDANTIELYTTYSLQTQKTFTSTPANNNHNLTRHTVNLTDNSLFVENHGCTTGDAIRIESLSDGSSSNALPTVGSDPITSGSRFFIGSVTTNSFTLHTLRSDALSSTNTLVTNAQDLVAKGVGSADIIPNKVQVSAVVNTSSSLKTNWNSLAATNIDADNIISGVITPGRLGSGTANSSTFLRGDSAYHNVVQSLKKANTTDNPIVLTGSSESDEFYGDPVNIGISNVDLNAGQTYSTLGVAKFLQSQFDVNSSANGEVFIKDGIVDAGTLDSLDSAYFLNPVNLTSNVPVSKGGTNISTYAVGDMLFASTSGTLSPLNIGGANSFLKSDGTNPIWSTSLELAEGLDVGSGELTTSSDAIGQLYNTNVTNLEAGSTAYNVRIGRLVGNGGTENRDISSFVTTYAASNSTTVTANLSSTSITTNAETGNTESTLFFASTGGVKYGQIISGSGSIPANTFVTGYTATEVYMSAATTGTVSGSTAITFTNSPLTLGIRAGDDITIASSGVANLDGTWQVLGATANATSFTLGTNANVTTSASQAGTIKHESRMTLRNTSVTIGDAPSVINPTGDYKLKAPDARNTGTNVSGGALTIAAGRGTGNSTGGKVFIKTGDKGSSGTLVQTLTTRMTIDAEGHVGIGSHEPDTTLHLKETAGTDTTLTIQRADNADDSLIVFEGDAGTSAAHIKHVGGGNDLHIGQFDGSSIVDRIKITGTSGNVEITSDLAVTGGDITTTATTFNLVTANATTVNFATGATSAVNIGNASGTVVINGNLQVDGTTTTVNTATLTVDDKNIELGSVSSPTDTTADGGGITLKGTSDHTIIWDNANDNWTSSEHWNIANGKKFKINNVDVLTATDLGTSVVTSSLTTVGALDAGSITANFGDINIGTSTFSGNGSGLTTLSASALSSGSIPDARVPASAVTQHQASITGTGALGTGSITSGFGDINIGTSTFTGNGSGLTTLDADELTTGTVAGARLGGAQSMAGVKTFTDTTAANSTTSGAVIIGGGLGVAGDVHATNFYGNGSNLTNLDAGDISTGTLASARINGSYTGLTGTGTLDAGAITTTFGNINIGSSIFTGDGSGLTTLNASELDSGTVASARLSGDYTGITGTGALDTGSITSNFGTINIGSSGITSGSVTTPLITTSGNMELRTGSNGTIAMQGNQSGGTSETLTFTLGGSNQSMVASDQLLVSTNSGQLTLTAAAGALQLNSGSFSNIDMNSAGAIEMSFATDSGLFCNGHILLGGGSTISSTSQNGNLQTQETDREFRFSGFNRSSSDGSVKLNLFNNVNTTQSNMFSEIHFSARNSDDSESTAPTSYTTIKGGCHTMTAGSEDGDLQMRVLVNGTMRDVWDWDGAAQVLTTNAATLDMNPNASGVKFRVETDGDVLADGDVTAFSTTISDPRLKENVEPVTDAMAKIKQLTGYTFDYKKDNRPSAGVLSTEVKDVLPSAVRSKTPLGDDTEYETVQYDQLSALFIEAIKEQQKQIDDLKGMVQNLLDNK